MFLAGNVDTFEFIIGIERERGFVRLYAQLDLLIFLT